MELIAKQKHLTGVKLPILICLLNLANPLATDMYAPAIPTMAGQLGTTDSMVNLTLTLYFGGCALGMLFSGPLTDKYGRKPLLVIGTFLFTTGALICALATDIGVLIAARLVCALGSGALNSAVMATVKDSFGGKTRQTVLSAMIATQMIGPVVAPVLGALLLMFLSWRAIFWLLVILGGAGFACSFLFTETAADLRTEGTFAVLGRLFVVLKNRSFRRFLLSKSVYSAGYMGHVACGSLVYVNFFGCSELQYSLFFAAMGIIAVFTPYLCNFICKVWGFRRFFSAIIVGSIVIGATLPITGPTSVWVFFGIMTVYCSITNGIQAKATDVAFMQLEGDNGSVSGLLNFVILCSGTVGMGAMALPWPSYFIALGVVIVAMFAIGGLSWILLLKSGELVE